MPITIIKEQTGPVTAAATETAAFVVTGAQHTVSAKTALNANARATLAPQLSWFVSVLGWLGGES